MMTYGWMITLWAFAGVVIVRLAMAPYWMAKEDAEKISALTDARNKRKIKDGLKQFFGSVDPIIRQKLSNPISEQEMHEYQERANAWHGEADRWIAENVGHAAHGKFNDTTNLMDASVRGAINERHNRIILHLTRLKANISSLIENDL